MPKVRSFVVACAVATTGLTASQRAVAAADPPVPPPIPAGVADNAGTLGYFATPDGAVAAVDLATGQRRWSSRLGRWPLAARAGWLAVAAPDGAQRNTLHVRFLRPADGKLLADAPVRFPDGIPVGAEAEANEHEVVIGAPNAALTLSVADASPGRLRLDWTASSWTPSGFRPSPVQRVSGVAIVDPSKGVAEIRPAPATAPPATSLLPAGFKPTPGAIYWSWSPHNANWADKPRAFKIAPGVVGLLSYESRPVPRLLVNRLRDGQPLPPMLVASNNDYAPLVSLDGKYLVLSRSVAERPVLTIFDLARGGAVPPTTLPPLDMKFLPPYAVIGPNLLFVVESEGAMGPGGATFFPRRLVALDRATGRVSWTQPLPTRVLPAPTPGAR